jgi:hypothetical protein
MDAKRMNEILIRRKGFVAIPTDEVGTGHTSKSILATFNKNLQDIGYILAPSVLDRLSCVPEKASVGFLEGILDVVKELKGVKHYRPMYPNFPQQVIDMDEAELYLNAILTYFSDWLADVTGDRDYIWTPKYKKDKREPLDEKVKLRVLKLAPKETVAELARQLATSNTSLSPTDKEDLKVLLADTEEFPEGIVNKETLAFVGALLFENDHIFWNPGAFLPKFKTATDVLRLTVALSGGDVSLAEPTKFRKFKRGERRKLLALLDKGANLEEDMLRWEGRWIRLSERLHPGDYWGKYHNAFSAIQAIRNGQTAQTFRSKVEESVRSGHVKAAIELLSDRPGEFGRRLDHLLRKARTRTQRYEAIRAFADVAKKASTPVLLQMMAHFDHRNDGLDRVIFPKGDMAKVMSIPTPPPLAPEFAKAVSRRIRVALKARFAELPALGRVYLDPGLKGFLLPFSQRSASKSLRTLVRGSHAPFGFEEKNTIRLFLWWKEPKGGMQSEECEDTWTTRVDLDLSAVFYDKDWQQVGNITYYELKNPFARHSGDIRSAPKGASEFIDIDIGKALAHNVRYVVTTVHGYTPQGFDELPECFVGWMLREKPQSGEVYDPRTVEDRTDITCKSRSEIPFIADLKEREVIWCDVTMETGNYWVNNVASSKGTIELLGKALSHVNKATVYDLLFLHAKARGTLVDDPKKADVEFSVRKGTQYELERLASEFMADAPKKAKGASA